MVNRPEKSTHILSNTNYKQRHTRSNHQIQTDHILANELYWICVICHWDTSSSCRLCTKQMRFASLIWCKSLFGNRCAYYVCRHDKFVKSELWLTNTRWHKWQEIPKDLTNARWKTKYKNSKLIKPVCVC